MAAHHELPRDQRAEPPAARGERVPRAPGRRADQGAQGGAGATEAAGGAAHPEREDVVARADGCRRRARGEHAARVREGEPRHGARADAEGRRGARRGRAADRALAPVRGRLAGARRGPLGRRDPGTRRAGEGRPARHRPDLRARQQSSQLRTPRPEQDRRIRPERGARRGALDREEPAEEAHGQEGARGHPEGRVRAIADQPGVPQPPHQRGASDAGGGRCHHPADAPARSRARRGRGDGQRARHPAGGPAQDLRPVLHDEGGRQGHRARALDLLQDRRGARRADHRRLQGRRRHEVHGDAAGEAGGDPRRAGGMSFERPTQIGKYEIVGELGRGGMGVVYRGHDPVIKRDVALKVVRKSDLDPNDAEQALERFKREARAAGNLHHPNIIAIYEYGEDADCAFIAMECVVGRSLRDHLIAGYRPELKVFPEILDQLLEGLEYSHSRGVIHRDIKPGNLLISEMGTAKISDFGIARLEQSHLTLMGEVLGTPYYMAPEQFDGLTADERSDVYSGAVIVYEVLTGRRPFEGHGANLMRQILEAPPPLPSLLEPRLPTAVDRVLLKALAKRPEDRFRSARQLLEALHLAFDDKPFTGKLSEIGASEITSPHLTNDETPSGTHRIRAGKVSALRRAIAAGTAQAAGPRAEPQGAKPEARGVRKPRVLFVDDEERVVNALRAIFRDGYDATVASSGEEALELVRTSHPFHVVVSDQRMPGMLGVELLRQVKLAAPSTVRLLLTGYSDLAAIVGSVNDGEVFRFVSKPWNQEDLQTTIAEAVTIAIALEASPPPRSTAPCTRSR